MQIHSDMHCSNHPSEQVVGVCAACLRERLYNLLEQQEDQNGLLLQEKSFHSSDSRSSIPVNPAGSEFSEESAAAASEPKIADLQRKSDCVTRDDLPKLSDDSMRRSKSVADAGSGTDLLHGPLDGRRKPSQRKSSWFSPLVNLDDRHADSQVCSIASSSVHRLDELGNPGSTPARATPSHGNVPKRKSAQDGWVPSWLASWLPRRCRRRNRFAVPSASRASDSLSLASGYPRPSQDEFSSIKDLVRTHDNVHRSAAQMFPTRQDPAQPPEEEMEYLSDTTDIRLRGSSRIHNPLGKGSQDSTVQYSFRDKKSPKVHANCAANARSSIEENNRLDGNATNPQGLGPRTRSAPAVNKLGIQEGPADSASPHADHQTTSSNRTPNRFCVLKKDFPGFSFCLSPLLPMGKKATFQPRR